MKTFKAIKNKNNLMIKEIGVFNTIEEMIDEVVEYCNNNNIIEWEIVCTWMPSYTNNVISWRD